MKNRYLASLLLLTALFISCDKEGIFKPEKKILAIYQQQITILNGDTLINTGKLIKERWKWNNDQLIQIDFCSGDHVYDSQFIEYNNNQITKIIMNDHYLTCTYEKRKLTKIDGYADGEHTIKIRFLEQDSEGHTTKMRIESPLQIDKNFNQLSSALRNLIPENIVTNMELILSEMTESKAEYVAEIVLQYDNDNVTEEKWTTADGVTTIQYTYDNKANPFYKAIFLLDEHSMLPFSRNNYLTIDRSNVLKSYTYQYEDDYPVKQTNTALYNASNSTIVSSVFYEYKE